MEIPEDDDEGVEEIPVQEAVSRMSKKSGSMAQRSNASFAGSQFGAASGGVQLGSIHSIH